MRPRTLLIGLALFLLLAPSKAKGGGKSRSRLSSGQLIDLAREVGFPDPEFAAAIAIRESGGDPSKINDTRGRTNLPKGHKQEFSIGLWQINTLVHKKWTVSQLLNPETNARATLEISKNGTDWGPWLLGKPPVSPPP